MSSVKGLQARPYGGVLGYVHACGHVVHVQNLLPDLSGGAADGGGGGGGGASSGGGGGKAPGMLGLLL